MLFYFFLRKLAAETMVQLLGEIGGTLDRHFCCYLSYAAAALVSLACVFRLDIPLWEDWILFLVTTAC